MRRYGIRARTLGALSAVLLVIAACGEGGGTATTTTEPTDEPIVIEAIHGSSLDFIHLVGLAAFEILEEEGYEVVNVFAQEAETAVQALVQGEAQVAVNLGVNVGVPAVDAGADIVDVVATQRPTWALAARPEFQTMESLEGARIGVHGEASFTRAVSIFFAEEYGYEYEELIIPGSDVRAEALARGELDASVIDLPDIVLLEANFPGSFHILQTMGERFPELIEADVWFSRPWAEANPEVAKDVVKAFVAAARRMTADTDYAMELAMEHLPDYGEEILESLVTEYSERGIWPQDGLISEERALATLQFFAEVGEIAVESPITAETVAKYFDFSYLESALQELDG